MALESEKATKINHGWYKDSNEDKSFVAVYDIANSLSIPLLSQPSVWTSIIFKISCKTTEVSARNNITIRSLKSIQPLTMAHGKYKYFSIEYYVGFWVF